MLKKIVILCTLVHIIAAEVPKEDVTFHLYTRENVETYIPLVIGEIENATVDGTKEFKIIVHGYTDTGNRDWVHNLKNAYFEKGDYNVISVDWTKPALVLYDESARNTRDVGKYLGDLIMELNQVKGTPYENFHLLGHSLGAHASGFAGKHIIATANAKVARITALDPAGPLFVGNSAPNRVDKEDAAFVDVIHTDAYKFGYADVLGHIDFYPNGGFALQPGCLTRRRRDLGPTFVCTHSRAYIYYTESINSNGFVATECDKWGNYLLGFCKKNPKAIMGENVDLSSKGVFYLKTNSESPFAKN